ncbi:MAG: hypothetical protein ACTSQI_10335 [Candidatus Helarchaeota archaeon]
MDDPIIFTENILELYDWNEFLKYVQHASLFIYEPDYFPTPFLHEEKIRCVNCYAIGVESLNFPLIIKFQKTSKNTDFSKPPSPDDLKTIIDSSMRHFIHTISTRYNAVRGKLHGSEQKLPWFALF